MTNDLYKRSLHIHGIYRHFKGGHYEVLAVATHSETEEKLVIYRQLGGERKVFARPYDSFIGLVDREKYPDAKQNYRMEFVSEPTY